MKKTITKQVEVECCDICTNELFGSRSEIPPFIERLEYENIHKIKAVVCTECLKNYIKPFIEEQRKAHQKNI